MKKARGSQEISEAYHQFQYHLVLFRLFRYAVFGIEVFLVVQPEVCAECLAEAEGDAARQALALFSRRSVRNALLRLKVMPPVRRWRL